MQRELLLVAGLLATGAVSAATEFLPRVRVSETYASNITLAPRGAEQEDFITELKPGFSWVREGTRLDFSLDYDLQALWYTDNSDLNDVYHQANGQAVGEIVEDRFFLDLDARYDQRNIDPANRQAISNLFRTGNRTDVASFEASPWWRQPLGDSAEALLRYTWSTVDYRNSDDEARTQDSDANRFDIGLGSAGGARWSWRLDYLNLDVNYDDAPDYAYERGGAEIGVPVGARSQFLVSGGRESDPLADRTKGGLDESWWNVGWRWIPTSRQDFEVRVGDRFYGTAWDAKWTRRGSRANLAVDYTEGPQTANSLEFDSNTTLPGGGYGQATPDARVFIRKRLSGLVTWGTAKSDWDLRIYGEQRDYADPQVAPADTEFESDDEAYGVRAGWTWRAFTRSRLVADGWWEEQDFEEGQGNFGRFSLGLVRELSQTLDLSLTYYRLIKNSEAIDDYRDNSVQLELAWYP